MFITEVISCLSHSVDLTRHQPLPVGPHFFELDVQTVTMTVAWPWSAPVPSLLHQATRQFGLFNLQLKRFRRHSPAARVFYISVVFSNVHRVLSQCNTRLSLLYLLNKHSLLTVMVTRRKWRNWIGNHLAISFCVKILYVLRLVWNSHCEFLAKKNTLLFRR